MWLPLITGDDNDLDASESHLDRLVKAAYLKDETTKDLLQAIKDENRKLPSKLKHLHLSLADCKEQEGFLYVREKLGIPEDHDLRLATMNYHHDLPGAGHPGKS